MRNLVLLSERTVRLPAGLAAACDVCVDAAEDTVVAVGPSSDSGRLSLATKDSVADVADSSEQVVGVFHEMEHEQAVVVLAGGSVVSVGNGGQAAEVVGAVDAGIAACAWSPDGALLALVTCAQRLVLVTADFDVVAECAVADGTEPEAQPVALGWGQRETQYQGRSGTTDDKQVAAEVTKTADDESGESPEVRVSWRGDGELLAVSHAWDGQRSVHVFSRLGRLQAVTEETPGLSYAMAWRPTGRVVAVAAQTAGVGGEVAFFERNGLRHGGFALRSRDIEVRDLVWSADAAILAVVYDGRVELWMDRNYHWYLAQELRVPGLRRVVWHPEDPLRLLMVSDRVTEARLHLAPAVARVAAGPDSLMGACVADGGRILYTPFAKANVPPPMAFATLETPMPVRCLTFATFGTGADFAALLADKRTVVLYSGAPSPKEQQRVVLPAPALQMVWPEPSVLVTLGTAGVNVVRFSDGGDVDFEPVELDAVVLAAAPHAGGRVLAESADGQVFVVSLDTPGFEPVAKLPALCEDLDAFECGGELVVLGRTRRNQLFAGSHVVSSSCSSFFLRSDLLVYTTTAHEMRFAPADMGLLDYSEVAGPAAGESRRHVERGSVIVLAAPAGDSVVLQMPRGNLETVRPRALSLALVRGALDEGRFRDALLACRVNRIDMNLLCDHNMAAFVEAGPEFVAQVADAELLNLFVAALRDEDVTRTMYRGLGVPADSGPHSLEVDGKATRVCRALRAVVDGTPKYMSTVLTTLMCERPPDIQAAVQLVATEESADMRERALTQLLFLSDVDSVYKAALATYDLPMALVVAQRSQRDPREYLPQLGELNRWESEEYRRFRIDQQLEHWELALAHLCAAYAQAPLDDLQAELIQFTQSHKLYELAICQLLPIDAECVRLVRMEYAQHLQSQKEWAQAAVAYLLAGQRRQAIDMFVEAREWRRAMMLASRPQDPLSVQAIYEVAVRASAVLAEHHEFGEAARVHLEYTQLDEDAVDLLVQGAHWTEAVRVAQRRGRSDLVETTVYPGIDASREALVEDMDEIAAAWDSKVGRLRAVRAQPVVTEELIWREVEGRADQGGVEVMSDTASMASQFTTFSMTNAGSQMTGSTARRISKKSKRKEERRKVRGKKGSIYEESYLVDSVAKLVDRVRVQQSIVQEMSLVLVERGQARAAAELQKKYASVVGQVEEDVHWVFDQQRTEAAAGPEAPAKHPKPALPSQLWRSRALQ